MTVYVVYLAASGEGAEVSFGMILKSVDQDRICGTDKKMEES